MDLSKIMLLPLGCIALVGACVPYPLETYERGARTEAKPVEQKSLTDEEQRQLDESRERLRLQEEAGNSDNGQNGDTAADPVSPQPKKINYPTASTVPGKPGFVFNPYTHSIVDVKGIGSGKLVRDPEDNDPTHKFRVP